MINVLSYIGMSLQSEVCLWTLLGLVRTIFDATLFKVNANLKQVWQMSMPEELSLPVQRVLRTMISGIMLVQCFTVYVYLASYIVLLYPVFLEERPTLVLPWLLLAAIRKLLCELTSLALGLGTCVLLGAARPPCIKFVIIKVISIMPSFYIWMLLYSYYHVLKVASVFKTFPVVLPPSKHDYGLELAVRRRRTKSLQGEEQLRRKLLSNFYNERQSITSDVIRYKPYYSSRMTHATDTSDEDSLKDENVILQPMLTTSNRIMSDLGYYDDLFGNEVMVPRDSDRILEQFGVMMLRIGAFLTKEGTDSTTSQFLNSDTILMEHKRSNHDCTTMLPDDTDTPPLVGSSKERTASYLRDYPQIFMKKPSDIPLHSDLTLTLAPDDRIASQILKRESQIEANEDAALNQTSSVASATDQDVLNIETPTDLLPRSSKETSQKKLQTMSSDKSVTFKTVKPKVTSTRRGTITVVKQKKTETSKSDDDKSTNLEEKDSLESIIADLKKRRSFKIKSSDKDENNNKTHSSTSSIQRKSDDDSTDSFMSNKSNNTDRNDKNGK